MARITDGMTSVGTVEVCDNCHEVSAQVFEYIVEPKTDKQIALTDWLCGGCYQEAVLDRISDRVA